MAVKRNPLGPLDRAATRAGRTLSALVRIPGFLRDPKLARTYVPAEARKSRFRTLTGLAAWALRHAELNDYYFAYELDRTGSDSGRYMGIREGKELIKRVNSWTWTGSRATDYRCLCKDKFLFGEYLAALAFPTAKNLALYDGSEVLWLDPRGARGLDSVLEADGLDAFCKDAVGAHGQRIFALESRNGRLLVDGKETAVEDLAKRMPVPGLLQERLSQHPALTAIYPHSVNTFRLVTILRGGKAVPFKGFMRFGAKGSRVDNWGAGGPAVAVDLGTGKLSGRGILMPGSGGAFTASHPETGVRFEGFEIPFFDEAVTLATRLHRFFYGLVTVGWDIAITPAGPVFIEGNNGWEIFALQAIVGGLRHELRQSLPS